ncbi:MAG TPA: hypothetical protein ENO09_03930 [bacterium]|nr:hypothetical protein [bacterium]
MPTYTDHTIEYWANVYKACRLEGENVTFASFLENPQSILQHFGMDDAIEVMESGFLPLLPKQARLRRMLDGFMPACESVTGQLIPLRPKATKQRGIADNIPIVNWGQAAA